MSGAFVCSPTSYRRCSGQAGLRHAEASARDGLATSSGSSLEATLRLGLVGALAAQGRVQDVIDEARLALGDAAVAPDVRAQLQAEAANALAFMDELDAAEEAARKAVALGTAGRSEGANLGRLVLCDTWRVRGRPFEALEQVEHVLKHPARRKGARLPWPAEVFLAMTLQQLDRFEEAHEALRKGRRADEELGNVSYLPVYDYETAALLFQAGRWDDAVAHAQTGLDLADEVGLEILRTWPHGILALIAVHRDDLDGASAAIASIEGRPGAETAGLARGLLAEARGDAAGALELLGCSWDRDTANGIVYRRRALGPDLVRLALAAGDHDRAKAVTAGVEEAARAGTGTEPRGSRAAVPRVARARRRPAPARRRRVQARAAGVRARGRLRGCCACFGRCRPQRRRGHALR